MTQNEKTTQQTAHPLGGRDMGHMVSMTFSTVFFCGTTVTLFICEEVRLRIKKIPPVERSRKMET